jgi:hypothetical protein
MPCSSTLAVTDFLRSTWMCVLKPACIAKKGIVQCMCLLRYVLREIFPTHFYFLLRKASRVKLEMSDAFFVEQ